MCFKQRVASARMCLLRIKKDVIQTDSIAFKRALTLSTALPRTVYIHRCCMYFNSLQTFLGVSATMHSFYY